MKIFYSYVFKSSILLIFTNSIFTVFSMDLPLERGSLLQRQPDEFVDYDSEGGSDEELPKNPQVYVPKSKSKSNSKSIQYNKSDSSTEDDYAETSLANVRRAEELSNEKKRSGFYKYLVNKTNGYDLCLMSDLPDTKKPKVGKIYLEKEDGHLKYIVLSSQKDMVIQSTLAISFNGELTHNILRKYKSDILLETSIRGHTVPKKIDINDLSYEKKIENIDHHIKLSIDNNTLTLQAILSNVNNPNLKKNTMHNFINTDESCKIFKAGLNSLRETLYMYHKDLIEVGLGYYAHKFFRLYYDYCKPISEDIANSIEGDSWEIWQWKYKIFNTNMKCFLLQFDSGNLSEYRANIRKKAENSLINYIKDSCRHLSFLYRSRIGFRAFLYQKGVIGSGTKRCFDELVNNYYLDFPFLKEKALVEKKIFDITQKYEKEISDFDKEVKEKGIAKTLLGEAPTIVASVGYRVIGTAWSEGGNLLSNAGTFFSTYYNTPQQIQHQVQAETCVPQGSSVSAAPEPKKGWFW